MTEPPLQVGEGRRDVRRPVRVYVLVRDPWQRLGELVLGRCEREAIGEIGATVAEREELGAQPLARPSSAFTGSATAS
jgi:hypothetical protein